MFLRFIPILALALMASISSRAATLAKDVTVAPGDEKTVGFATTDPGDQYQLDVYPDGDKKFKTDDENILSENTDHALWQRTKNEEAHKQFQVTSGSIHEGHEALFKLNFKKDGGGGGGGKPLDPAYVKAVNCFVKAYLPGTIAAPGALIPAPTAAGKTYTGLLQRNTDDDITTGVADHTVSPKTGDAKTKDNDLVKIELSWNPTVLRSDMVAGKTLKLTVPAGATAYKEDGSLLTDREVTIGSPGSSQLAPLAGGSRKQNIFVEGGAGYTPGELTLAVNGLDVGGAIGKVHLTSITFITPAGDPVASPVDSGDGQNEFTFDNQSPGKLSITLKASAPNFDQLPASVQNGVVFDFVKDVSNQIIGTSAFAWDAANPGGKPTFGGGNLTAIAKFTTLPDQNAAFGKKFAQVKLGAVEIAKEDFEVFFPRDEKNHPGVGAGTTPNWFFYWRQVYGANLDIEYRGSSGSSQTAEVPAMTGWGYTATLNKNLIYVYDSITTKYRGYGVGEEFSGIDQWVGTIIHETKHLDQIARADTLVATGASFQNGWSWNVTPHNHWSQGSDNQWGVAGVDDDANGIIDDAAIPSGPNFAFEPGTGDDVSLDHPNFIWWPNSWSIPSPNNAGHPIESEAVNYSDANNNENDHAQSDWGDPGKNHKTINKYDD